MVIYPLPALGCPSLKPTVLGKTAGGEALQMLLDLCLKILVASNQSLGGSGELCVVTKNRRYPKVMKPCN